MKSRFGGARHYTAMQALGTPDAWHPPHGFLIPHAKFRMVGPDSFFGDVDNRIASRG